MTARYACHAKGDGSKNVFPTVSFFVYNFLRSQTMGRINGTIVRINTLLLRNYKIKRGSMQLDFYDYMAFVVFGIITTLFVSLVVVIGSLPGKIAIARKHPQANAINVASWVSLLTLGALWPIAFVWAFIEFRPSASNNQGTSQS